MNDDPRSYCVYIHQNLINGKCYCGQTVNTLTNRSGINGTGYKDCPRFWNAICKYGWDNFSHYVLIENLSKEMADIVEIEVIKKYNLTNPDYGYNIQCGGQETHPPFEDLTGKKFGRLTVISFDHDNKTRGRHWLCKCCCENHSIVSVYEHSLTSGATKSCGCYRDEKTKERSKNRTDWHRKTGTPIYSVWKGLRNRKNAISNITEEWQDFKMFYEWSVQSGYKDGDKLIRIDNTKPYQPDNCEWCSKNDFLIRNGNDRATRYEYNGELLTLKEIGEKYNINLNALRQKMFKYKNINDAMNSTFVHDIISKTNSYTFYQDYVLVETNSHDQFIVDVDDYNLINEYHWSIDKNQHVMTKKTNSHPSIRIESLLLGIPNSNMKRTKIQHLNGNDFDFRKNNLSIVIPKGCDEYLYYVYNIIGDGFIHDHKSVWRIGKKNEYRKYVTGLENAIRYYDERYGTNFLEQYIQSQI